MGCRTIAVGWGLWCVAVVAAGLQAPSLYAAACVVLTGLWFVIGGVPGLLTANAMADYSGKGHRSNLPSGCFPITFVLDVVSAPLQLPLLAPLAVDWYRKTRDRLRAGAALLLPETVAALIDKARRGELADWECEALEKACREEGMIDPDDVPTLVGLFCRAGYPRHAEAALVGLIERQAISPEDLGRIFTAQTKLGRYDRYSRVLMALACHPEAPTELLRDLRDFDAPGSFDRFARKRLEERGSS